MPYVNSKIRILTFQGGGSAIPSYLLNAIDEYLKENSNIASNRLTINQKYKKLVLIRYLQAIVGY